MGFGFKAADDGEGGGKILATGGARQKVKVLEQRPVLPSLPYPLCTIVNFVVEEDPGGGISGEYVPFASRVATTAAMVSRLRETTCQHSR